MMPAIPTNPFYTSSNRWKLLALFFGFLADDGVGGYFWVPDNQTLWESVKAPYSLSNPTGKDYDNRLFRFAEFWLTTRKSEVFLAIFLLGNLEYPTTSIDHFVNMPNFIEPLTWVQNMIDESFELKFLPYIKSLTF
ncbi:hypothetical protein G3O08_18065 [Cryomorpha ignava]|uniref:Uncharacterized protein n=1 Tax=Cryomorpha ignava TaxID=101383 RepID=A0A7K3WV98_9FLAO|nr:hypothetical protein [Cryomorpha ignava]NEN25406.1 hypothetical protein [Cryomorpha ignava]